MPRKITFKQWRRVRAPGIELPPSALNPYLLRTPYCTSNTLLVYLLPRRKRQLHTIGNRTIVKRALSRKRDFKTKL